MRLLAACSLVFLSLPLFAAKPYHLELEAAPAAVFPYLGKFGTVELHVYAGGVRAEALWLNSFSRNGASDVTVMNPLGRMYVELPVSDIAPIVKSLAGDDEDLERISAPKLSKPKAGKVGSLAATRHRLVYGPEAWIDVWTANSLPENAQLRRIVNGFLEGISPATAKVASGIRGTPIYVELNFRRFKKVQLLKLKKLTMTAGDEKTALARGPIYVRASVLEKIFEK